MGPLKNIRLETFCREYAKGGNATEAMLVAYPSRAGWSEEAKWTAASRILKSAKVLPRVAELREEAAARNEVVVGDNEGRNVLRYPADAKYGYATWNQSIDALKLHTEEIKRNFFMELQLPDMSMDNMKSTPMSGEARKMVFIDAQMKVEDEAGTWLEAFEREDKVIRCFMKKMYPGLATAIDNLEVEHRITPYQIKDEAEKLGNIQTACGGKPFMSQRTAVKEAGYVDDVDAELEELQAAEMADISEPTF